MRISDWSSDVCSSDLFEIYYFDEAVRGDGYADLRATNARQWRTVFEEDRGVVEGMQAGRASPAFTGGVFSPAMDTQIGRASCRERVCPYVYTPVGAVSLKKKTRTSST